MDDETFTIKRGIHEEAEIEEAMSLDKGEVSAVMDAFKDVSAMTGVGIVENLNLPSSSQSASSGTRGGKGSGKGGRGGRGRGKAGAETTAIQESKNKNT